MVQKGGSSDPYDPPLDPPLDKNAENPLRHADQADSCGGHLHWKTLYSSTIRRRYFKVIVYPALQLVSPSVATARMQQFSLFVASPVVCMMQLLN